MLLLRQVVFIQPDYQWQYQLRYERDVTSQIEAIEALSQFPTPQTRLALTDTIENEHCFYRVRCAAAFCLRQVANNMVATWAGPPAMMTIFRKMFGSHSCPHIIRQNNFSNFQHYFLQKAIPVAMAGLRTIHGICPPEVMKFLFDLFKYNENSKNKFSDNYYRTALIEALGETVTPVVSVLAHVGQPITVESLSADTKLILEEITRCLNLEKLLPCYKYTITVGCLKAIRKLQKMGHLPNISALFREYAQYGLFLDVRLAALEALVDYTTVDGNADDLSFLLDIVENDPVPRVRLALLLMLTQNPPFSRRDDSPFNTEELAERLWKLMSSGLSHDSRLRCAVVDLYYVLYGKNRPSCLSGPDANRSSLSMVLNLKEKKAKFQAPAAPEDDFFSVSDCSYCGSCFLHASWTLRRRRATSPAAWVATISRPAPAGSCASRIGTPVWWASGAASGSPCQDLSGGAVLEDVDDVLDAIRVYRTRDVYAAQETALFYGALPHETRAFKEDPCAGGSRSTQRLTVFLCSNMDGSDKRPPLVVGKSDRPKCFQGSKRIPIKYVSHPKAWMTSLLFCNWLCDFNASMVEQGRSVCLLVSRCAAHAIGELSLSNVRLCYVSADAQSSLPCPLNLGVVNRLKCAYRQSLIDRFLLNIQLERVLAVDLYQALQMLVEAWNRGTVFTCAASCPRMSTSVTTCTVMLGLPAVEEENGEVILGSLQNDLLFEDLEDCDGVVLREPSLREVLEAIDLLRVHCWFREEFDVAFEAIELYESCIKAVLWKQMKLEPGSIVSGVELLAEAALTATERLDTQVILLGDADHIKTEEEAVVTTQSLEATDAEVTQVEQDEVYVGADEQQLQHEPPAEPEPVEVIEQPHHEPEEAAHSDVEHMEVEVEEPVAVTPVQPQTSVQPQQKETSHSSAESGPVAVPLVPIQPADINYSDDSQSKSLPGLTGASTHHQPTGFDSSMFKMGAPLPEVSQPQAVPQTDVAAPTPLYPSAAGLPLGVFSLSVTPSTSLGGVSSATGGEADDVVGTVSSKVHKDKKKKKKKDKKHKHKHKHRSHDRLLEKERFYSSGGSTNQSPAPFGGGASSSPQHEII
ncbi:hypothetical protein HPB51_004889 [Rhipicephalus microplus]|uniref:Transcription initiation factor TFIID 150 kDa subunit n=1 Tax=Rhipicephalus microplus TaxID=6941 RepID=A0A9J6E6D0_RHIMP|nr:hypothetical protein HPB51_004889 [Rhipicephalus microplus]